MQRRLIMHVDMDAFYASIEQRDRKELRGKPVIIGGLSGREWWQPRLMRPGVSGFMRR